MVSLLGRSGEACMVEESWEFLTAVAKLLAGLPLPNWSNHTELNPIDLRVGQTLYQRHIIKEFRAGVRMREFYGHSVCKVLLIWEKLFLSENRSLLFSN
jgi:hypothetical protein